MIDQGFYRGSLGPKGHEYGNSLGEDMVEIRPKHIGYFISSTLWHTEDSGPVSFETSRGKLEDLTIENLTWENLGRWYDILPVRCTSAVPSAEVN